jgi:hypothetical protein
MTTMTSQRSRLRKPLRIDTKSRVTSRIYYTLTTINPVIQGREKVSVFANTNFKDKPATDPGAGSLQLTKLGTLRMQMSRRKMKLTTNGHNYKGWKDFWSNKNPSASIHSISKEKGTIFSAWQPYIPPEPVF